MLTDELFATQKKNLGPNAYKLDKEYRDSKIGQKQSQQEIVTSCNNMLNRISGLYNEGAKFDVKIVDQVENFDFF